MTPEPSEHRGPAQRPTPTYRGRRPLDGALVVDFSSLLPGPAATQNLVALGAEVVKVEPPGGDPARYLYGAAVFTHYNQGKRSVVLDLKDDDGRRRARALCDRADVVIESYRTGTAARLGIDHRSLADSNPRLVYCSLKAFASDGPRSERGAHDLNLLALSGALSQPGSWSARGFPPVRPAVPVVDLAAASVATQAILAGLLERERSGDGGYIEISMYEVISQWAAARLPVRGASSDDERDPGLQHLDPANDIYAGSDGEHLTVSAIERRSWRALCDLARDHALGLEAMADWDSAERSSRGEQAHVALRRLFSSAPARAWVSRLQEAGIPAELVTDLVTALADPWLVERGAVVDGRAQVPLPFGDALGPPPALDEHQAWSEGDRHDHEETGR